ncbi:MAG TPA: hypothetical protein VGB64_05715 [Actinomycetota bacterium]
MSVRPTHPIRWIAAGAAALIVTIYSALMLGLNVPSVRAVPLAPWAGAGYGADRHEPFATAPVEPGTAPETGATGRGSGGAAPPPARVAGGRFPAADDDDNATRFGADDPRSEPAGVLELLSVPSVPDAPAVLEPSGVPSLGVGG